MEWQQKITGKIKYHLLGWAIFILYEVSLIHFTAKVNSDLVHYFFYYALNIILFYTHSWILTCVFTRFRNSYLTASCFFISELTVYLLVKYTMDFLLGAALPEMFQQLTYIKGFLILNSYRCIYIAGLSTIYWLFNRMLIYQKTIDESEKRAISILKEKAELERDLAIAKNAFLQHQIKPHLLFNTLNFIYSKVCNISKEATECILLLCDVLRYSLYGPEEDGKTNLKDEIEQMNNIIRINELKSEKPPSLRVILKGNFANAQIIPLILITFTENIINHADLGNQEHPGILEIDLDEHNMLTYRSVNQKSQKQNSREHSSGIGIRNAITRLNLAYPGHYKLDMIEEADHYQLKLSVQL